MASASSQLFKRVSTMVSLFNLLLKRTVTVIDSILETFTDYHSQQNYAICDISTIFIPIFIFY
ncbi:hypothetical protein WDW89_23465 [Deltaproteobacteria bacterium TL4]